MRKEGGGISNNIAQGGENNRKSYIATNKSNTDLGEGDSGTITKDSERGGWTTRTASRFRAKPN